MWYDEAVEVPPSPVFALGPIDATVLILVVAGVLAAVAIGVRAVERRQDRRLAGRHPTLRYVAMGSRRPAPLRIQAWILLAFLAVLAVIVLAR